MSKIQTTQAAIPFRTTSVTVKSAPDVDGRAAAEDMHGMECFIDTRTRLEVDAEPRPGHIFEAQIDPAGWISHARLTGRAS